jgi:Uma2 family endonuclease
MSLPQTIARHTVEEYLALERESEERHEYLDGQIYAMAGESTQHGDISVNLVRDVSTQLKGTPSRVWTKDSKVLSGPAIKHSRSTKGLFSYPDLVVVCGEPRFLDEHQDVLLNPTVIIEVLSPTTESFDRGEKFRRYRTQIPSLTDYVLVSQAWPLIEHFHRQTNDEWILSTAIDIESSLQIASIDCTLHLSEVYDRVTFPEETSEPQDGE